MNDDSLDKLFRVKVRERETVYPSHLPSPDVLWHSLNEKRHRQKTKQLQFAWRAAAAVLIVMMAGSAYFFQGRHNDHVTAMQAPDLTTQPSNEQRALDYIIRRCAEKNISCNSPAIQDLRSDLEESFRKIKEIDQRIQLYGQDADLIRARTRIESHQARVIKTIIQTI